MLSYQDLFLLECVIHYTSVILPLNQLCSCPPFLLSFHKYCLRTTCGPASVLVIGDKIQNKTVMAPSMIELTSQ